MTHLNDPVPSRAGEPHVARVRRRRLRLASKTSASVVLVLVVLLVAAGYRWLQDGAAEPGSAVAAAPRPLERTVQPAAAPAPAPLPARRVEAERPALDAAPPVPAAPREPEPKTTKTKRQLAERRPPAPRPAEPQIRLAGGPGFFDSESAVLLSVPAASYPADARGTGTWAEVVVAVSIDANGAVEDPAIQTSRVEGSAPDTIFEEAALTAARQARYAPAREEGVPVPSRSTLTFTFGTAAPRS